MSGHSHFKTVAATKNANDAKRGKIFSKMGRVITIAVKQGGADPSSNIQLKALMEKAREFNMPKENVERAIKKGTGELVGEALEEVSVEGFGPGGIALIIEGITDNTNRTLGEVKSILQQHGGKMAGEGAVRWMFQRKGVLKIDSQSKEKEALELFLIESGADDLQWQGMALTVYTAPENLEKVKKAVEANGNTVLDASLSWVPNEEVTLSDKEKEASEKLFLALDENDAIQDIYSNLKSS